MRVLAISDLHLDFGANLGALQQLSPHEDDWLIIAGDIGHRLECLDDALDILTPKFAKLIWVPGNHDLWGVEREGRADLRGVAKYDHMVSMCRERGALTPEDPYETLQGDDGVTYALAPLFLLYDYSFRPDDVPLEGAVRWARDTNVLCTDEQYLDPAPYPTRGAWCEARCQITREKLDAVPPHHRLILINHFPLREDLIRIYIPRFRIWCGTRQTEDWHTRYNVATVVSGHLHVRRTVTRDGVRFEEVSLGYPRQWNQDRGLDSYLTQILPLP